jgi:hypothetical protein
MQTRQLRSEGIHPVGVGVPDAGALRGNPEGGSHGDM